MCTLVQWTGFVYTCTVNWFCVHLYSKLQKQLWKCKSLSASNLSSSQEHSKCLLPSSYKPSIESNNLSMVDQSWYMYQCVFIRGYEYWRNHFIYWDFLAIKPGSWVQNKGCSWSTKGSESMVFLYNVINMKNKFIFL